jgi:hypothetical protein
MQIAQAHRELYRVVTCKSHEPFKGRLEDWRMEKGFRAPDNYVSLHNNSLAPPGNL